MKTYRSPGSFKVAILALLSLSFVGFLGKSYETSLRGIDSNIHAKASMDVTSRGFTPQLPIPETNANYKVGGAYFNDHPFFYFWLNGWVMRALGPSAWSARVLTSAFSAGCVLLVLLLGMSLHSRLFGFIAATSFLFTRDIILTGATVSLDPPMMFFILLSFFFWRQKNWILLGISTGVGLWIKTPVVLLVYPTAFLVSQMSGKGRSSDELPQLLRSLILALFLGSWVWVSTGLLGGWYLVKDYWIRQLWGTAIGGRHQAYASDWLMFFRMVKRGFLPGLPFLIIACFQIIRRRLWKEPIVQISLTAIGILFIAITPMRFRMDYYYNPTFPFLALLSAFSVYYLLKPYENRVYSIFAGATPVLMAFLLCTPTSFGPEAFVALKRFVPLIQSYGNCEDGILLIPGGEPIGSAHDYRLVLNFYTGKTVDIAGCESVGVAIRRKSPQWVILSRENYEHCLTREEQYAFKRRFVVGNQYLLTNLIPQSQETDLTPLERELKPVVDCRPQAYPRDRYHRY